MSALRKYKRHLISARLLEAQTREKTKKDLIDKLIKNLTIFDENKKLIENSPAKK